MSVSIEMQGYIRKNHRLPSITTKQKGRKTRYRNRIQCFLWLSSAFSFHLCSFCVPLLFFLNKFHRSFWIRFPTPSLATKHETNKKKSEGEREREMNEMHETLFGRSSISFRVFAQFAFPFPWLLEFMKNVHRNNNKSRRIGTFVTFKNALLIGREHDRNARVFVLIQVLVASCITRNAL